MRLISKSTLGLTLSLGALFFSSCKQKQESTKKEEGSVYKTSTSVELCDASWFPHSQTKNPIEGGEKSPFSAKSSTNKMFHQWSWQKFLWLTKPTKKKGTDVPLFLNSSKIFQVTSHMEDVDIPEGVNVVLTDTLQAGDGKIVLRTNPSFNSDGNSETVFYSIYIDSIFKESALKFGEIIKNDTVKRNNNFTFPFGSLELKASWVATSALPKEEVNNYYTTMAQVIQKNKGKRNIEVALSGMHVVGVVENHPEFIWATFEHDDLAPNYNWEENKASSENEKLLFSKGSVENSINGIKWDRTDRKNQKPVETYKVYDLFQYGVPRNPDGTFMETSQGGEKNFNNVNDINNCVKKNLKDVWKNYFYNGSIWLNTDGMSPEAQAAKIVELGEGISSGEKGALTRGSLNCANVTMESFTQTFENGIQKVNVKTLANCFSCHNSVSFKTDYRSPLYLSHVFDAYAKGLQGHSKDEVEMLKAAQELQGYIKTKL
ncbi:hypothetical protein SAMN04489761_3975 [Tenacibaculum sp. MAR_2009_124]|uniref:hypothetical protein n=1 Tax=Tenacibaculum sp. MAR_2009_124 TaxID=1250059 RepID=UPI0008971079|nr:hypothetical protein [Tenacibaculum sp. MAR_2009_124]SEC92264.1 hypothetical protein SAMN04489761_3975 [Tenacibaculum sp. MAR_2009_124]